MFAFCRSKSARADDFFDFSEETYELIGKSFNRHYTLGMPLRVKLVDANPVARTIDFELIDDFHGNKKVEKPRSYAPVGHKGKLSRQAEKAINSLVGMIPQEIR